MPRRSSKRISPINKDTYEPFRKNGFSLLEDENLDEHFKSVRVGNLATPLQLSKDGVKVSGKLFLDKLGTPLLEADFSYLELRPKVYTRFSSSDYTGALDLYVTSGNSYFLTSATDYYLLGSTVGQTTLSIGDTTNVNQVYFDLQNGEYWFKSVADTGDYFKIDVNGNGETTLLTVDDDGITAHLTLDIDGDITLDADTGNIYFKDGGTLLCSIDSGAANAFKIHASLDSGDLFSITTAVHGATTIATTDDDATAAHLTIDPDGSLILDPADGKFIAKKAGTEFSAADSAYAGMILGYTCIGLNESHTTLNLTTSYVVPTDEFSVEFTAPPSGNVEVQVQIQHHFGSSGVGDLYAGLSTANATSGYSALASHHEFLVNDGQGRNAVDTVQILWTITGLTAGTDYEYWVGFKAISATGTPKIQWGGSSSGRYADFIMKAAALPATITT